MKQKLYVAKYLKVDDKSEIPTFACKVCGDYFTATEVIKHWYEETRRQKIPIVFHEDDSFLADNITVVVKANVEEQELLLFKR